MLTISMPYPVECRHVHGITLNKATRTKTTNHNIRVIYYNKRRNKAQSANVNNKCDDAFLLQQEMS